MKESMTINNILARAATAAFVMILIIGLAACSGASSPDTSDDPHYSDDTDGSHDPNGSYNPDDSN